MNTANIRIANALLSDAIKKHGDRILLVEPSTGEAISYLAFGQRLAQVARLLKNEGVARRDVVTLISDNSIDLATMIYGVIAYGAIAKPLNPKLTPIEILNLLKHSGSKIIFADGVTAPNDFEGKSLVISTYRDVEPSDPDEAWAANAGEDDGALLIYTSGTTGSPKGVLLSQRNLAANTLTAVNTFSLDSTHVKACILPLFHTFGFISDLSASILCGGKVVILPTFDITRLKDLATATHEHSVNSFSAVPLIFELLLRLDCDLNRDSMKFCVSGAAPLSEKVAVDFRRKYGFTIIPAYGLTESTCFCTISPPDAIVDSSIGKPADIEIKIISDNGKELSAGERGELIIKGQSVMRGGYYKNEEQCYADDGGDWFKTGDIGYFDSQGFFFITGRKKNMAIHGGEKVYLEDIDRCLQRFDVIADSATVRVDNNGVDRIACFVVLNEEKPASSREIISFIKENLGGYKYPDVIVFRDSIPRTATNKVRMGELQKQAKEYV